MTTPAAAPGVQFTADVAWAVADLNKRGPLLAKRRRYYEGQHDSALPPGKTLSRNLRDLLEDLSDNLCDDVVDESVSRSEIINFTGKSVEQGAAAWAWWERNKGPARHAAIMRDSWGLGDGIAMVQETTSGGRAPLYVQHPEQWAIRYSKDLPDKIELAAKAWRDGKRYRLNLYYAANDEESEPARIERWATRGLGADGGLPQARAFVRYDDGERGPSVEPRPDWAERLPIFHFPADEVGRYGRSVLTDVINLQDVLNKSVVDLVVAMEDVALPQRYATGVQVQIDENGREVPLFRRSATDEMLRTASTEAGFGQFPGTDLTQFLQVQTSYRAEIARKGYLPPYSVGLPSNQGEVAGISLLVMEGRQIKRVKSAQRDWGEEIKAMVAHGLTLEGIKTDPSDLDLEWGPVETRDERALVETVGLKVDLGLPKREGLIELGYDEDDVREWMDEGMAQAQAISGGRMSLPGAGLPSLTPQPPQGPAGAPQPAVPGV